MIVDPLHGLPEDRDLRQVLRAVDLVLARQVRQPLPELDGLSAERDRQQHPGNERGRERHRESAGSRRGRVGPGPRAAPAARPGRAETRGATPRRSGRRTAGRAGSSAYARSATTARPKTLVAKRSAGIVRPDASIVALSAEAPPDRLLAARVLREEAIAAGFARVGIARAQESPGAAVSKPGSTPGFTPGCATSRKRRRTRVSPEGLLPGARSVVVPRRAPFRRTLGRGRRLAIRPVRPWRRLPRHAARARAGRPRTGPRADRHRLELPRLRRLDADRRAGIRRGGGSGLDRKERLPDRPGARLVSAAGRDPARPRSSCGRARRRAVRILHAVPGCLPHRRLRRARPARRRPLPRLLDDRAPRPDSRHVEGRARRPRLRLRRLPGGLPVERTSRARGGRLASPLPPAPRSSPWARGAWERRFARTAVNRGRRAGASSATRRPRRERARMPVRPPALRDASRVEEPGLADAARWALDRMGRLPL